MTRSNGPGEIKAGPNGESRPSRARFTLLALLCTLTGILYLDRVCMAQALQPIQAELGLTDTQMGLVLGAFTLAYGLFELPTGYWGDRIGARRVLPRIAVWWSVFTVVTGACQGFGSLLVVRFLFGAGEAGALPNAARVIARWYPARERGRIPAALTFTALLGGTLTPVLAGYLIGWFGWRPTFAIFGVTGIVWAFAFRSWFRDDPAGHPSVNPGELALIGEAGSARKSPHGPIPWRSVALTPTVWLLGLSMACSSFNSYLYFSWFPKYLQAARGVEQVESGWLASGVLGGGACGMLLGGFVVDYFCGHGGMSRGRRRLLGVSGFVLGSALLLLAFHLDSPFWSSAATALSFLAVSSVNSLWWTSATAVSGKHIGSLFGLMNSMGVAGAFTSQVFFGWFSDWRKSTGHLGRDQWDPAFYVYVIVLSIGAASWLFIDPTRSVDDREAGALS